MKKSPPSNELRFYARATVQPGKSKKDGLYYRAEVFSEKIGCEEDVAAVFSTLIGLDKETARYHVVCCIKAIVIVTCLYKKLYLKELGLLYFSLKSQLRKGKRGVTAESIEGVYLRIKPSLSLRSIFSKFVFRKTEAPEKPKEK